MSNEKIIWTFEVLVFNSQAEIYLQNGKKRFVRKGDSENFSNKANNNFYADQEQTIYHNFNYKKFILKKYQLL